MYGVKQGDPCLREPTNNLIMDIILKPKKREKKYQGFDLFQDQIAELDKMAKEHEISKADIVRSIFDTALGLPKEKEED